MSAGLWLYLRALSEAELPMQNVLYDEKVIRSSAIKSVIAQNDNLGIKLVRLKSSILGAKYAIISANPSHRTSSKPIEEAYISYICKDFFSSNKDAKQYLKSFDIRSDDKSVALLTNFVLNFKSVEEEQNAFRNKYGRDAADIISDAEIAVTLLPKEAILNANLLIELVKKFLAQKEKQLSGGSEKDKEQLKALQEKFAKFEEAILARKAKLQGIKL